MSFLLVLGGKLFVQHVKFYGMECVQEKLCLKTFIVLFKIHFFGLTKAHLRSHCSRT